MEKIKSFGRSSFKKNMISPQGFQFADMTKKAQKDFLKLMKKHKNLLIIQPSGNPGITLYKK